MFEELALVGKAVPELLLELLAAVMCGSLIGLAPGLKRRAISMRQSVMICFGTVMYVDLASFLIIKNSLDAAEITSNLISQVIIGISIISAGILITGKDKKSAFEISALVWVMGAVGLIIGVNQWLLGLLLTGLFLLILTILKSIENSLDEPHKFTLLKVTVKKDSEELRSHIRNVFEKKGALIQNFHVKTGPAGVMLTITVSNTAEDIRFLIGEVWTIKDVIEVEH